MPTNGSNHDTVLHQINNKECFPEMHSAPANKPFQLLAIIEDYWYKYVVIY